MARSGRSSSRARSPGSRTAPVCACLSHLLRQPGHEVLALDLAAAAAGQRASPFRGHAGGPLIDAEARAATSGGSRAFRETLADAETCNDFERATAPGPRWTFSSGRSRGEWGWAPDAPGRHSGRTARVNVTRTIKGRSGRSPSMIASRRHLTATIHTGIFCSYEPDPRLPLAWAF